METLNFTNKQDWLDARVKDVTSTETAALFNLSKYATRFELWHRKKNQQILELEETDDMKLGKYLQDGIGKFYAEKFGWEVKPMEGVYKRLPELRLGASYDFEVIDKERGLGILEVKKVRFNIHRDEWLDGEAPPDIECQVQTQLLVGDYKWAAIVPLVGGNVADIIYRQPDLEMHEAITNEVKTFWQTIDNNAEPTPVLPDDADFIISQYKTVNALREVDLSDNNRLGELIAGYNDINKQMSALEAQKKTYKAEMMPLVGDAAKARYKGFTINAGMVEAEVKAHVRKYRNFRVTGKEAA